MRTPPEGVPGPRHICAGARHFLSCSVYSEGTGQYSLASCGKAPCQPLRGASRVMLRAGHAARREAQGVDGWGGPTAASSAPGMGSPASTTSGLGASLRRFRRFLSCVQCMEKVGVDETQVGATSATGPSGAPVKSGFLDKTPQPGFSRPKTRWFVLHQVQAPRVAGPGNRLHARARPATATVCTIDTARELCRIGCTTT